jgi:protein involved in polysaccharide export with SLBB domain
MLTSTPTTRWRRRPGREFLALAVLACASLLASGCASVSNPVGQGIPVHRLPAEYLAPPKEDLKDIPLTYLQQKKPEAHRVDKGDVLGVYIENILGDSKVPPPVRLPDKETQEPSMGFPVVVGDDGTLPLPIITPLNVKDLTIKEVRAAVIKAYIDAKLLQPGKEPGTATAQVLVSLLRPRHVRVQVMRQDSATALLPNVLGTAKKGTGAVVDLPAYENDVLNALTRTGGLPGLDAINEVIVQRGDPFNVAEDQGRQQNVRLPLRIREGEQVPFRQDDVILKDGDIVFIKARDTEVFYVGGLVQAHQFVLPRDYDLRVVEAISLAGGPLVNGAQQVSNLTGTTIQTGLGSPSPSRLTVLRKTKGNGQVPIIVDFNKALNDPRENIIVQSGDVLILQETVFESMTRYFSGTYRFSVLNVFSNVPNLVGSNSFVGP